MAENDIAAVVEINRKKAKPLKKKVLLAAALYSVIFGALNFMLCWFTIMTSRMQRDLDMFLPSLLFRLTLSSAFIHWKEMGLNSYPDRCPRSFSPPLPCNNTVLRYGI